MKKIVGLLILAGGQGTRLGYNHAKGMYNIEMPSNRSIFELLCKRFLRSQIRGLLNPYFIACEELKKPPITNSHIYIMTSPINDLETKAFFKDKQYFGIPEDKLHFVTQGTLPAIDTNGGILMEGKAKLALTPNGNGGIFICLLESDSTLFHEMQKSGIEYLHIIGIDNVLNKVLDPLQVGLSIHKKISCVIKVLPKKHYKECIGIFANIDKKGYELVEYSEISEDMAKQTNEKGELLFNHGKCLVLSIGNILNFFVSLPALLSIFKAHGHNLTNFFHIASKKIPYYSEGKLIKPNECNGYKFELFISGFIPYLEEDIIFLQIKREEEFAPVKNEKGSAEDSPDTARAMISSLHRSWLTKVGAVLEGDGLCEIDESLSYEGENLASFKGKVIKAPVYLKNQA